MHDTLGTNRRGSHRLAVLLGSLGLAIVFALSGPTGVSFAAPLAQTAPLLGAAASYSVLSAAGVTDGPPVLTSTFTGDVGASNATYTGINPGPPQFIGTGVLNPPTIATAMSDAGVAWGALSTPPQALAGSALSLAGNNTVGPGIYDISADPTGGTLTLNGPGVYILRSASSVADPGGFTVDLIGGADPCNVFWQIQTSWTSGAGSVLVGTFITQTASITLGDGTTVDGRVIALGSGAVTLINNHFTGPNCITTEEETVRGLPDTGGAPIQDGSFPWSLVILGGFSAAALALGVRAYRRNYLPKQ